MGTVDDTNSNFPLVVYCRTRTSVWWVNIEKSGRGGGHVGVQIYRESAVRHYVIYYFQLSPAPVCTSVNATLVVMLYQFLSVPQCDFSRCAMVDQGHSFVA